MKMDTLRRAPFDQAKADAVPWHLSLSLDTWPNCETPDCEYKCCTWSERPDLCAKCGERVLGKHAMDRRYDETHQKSAAECELEKLTGGTR